MKKHYIKGVLEMLGAGKDASAVIDGLKGVLKAKGHTRLYASVLRGVLVILSSDNISSLPIVTVANKTSFDEQKSEIESALSELNATGEFESVIDETLIGGHSVSFNNMILDRSYKSTLTNLYRSITK